MTPTWHLALPKWLQTALFHRSVCYRELTNIQLCKNQKAQLTLLCRLAIKGAVLFKTACLHAPSAAVWEVFLRSAQSLRKGEQWDRAAELWGEDQVQPRLYCSMFVRQDYAPVLPGHSCSKTLRVNSQGVWDRILSFFCGESHYSCSGLQSIVGIFSSEQLHECAQ